MAEATAVLDDLQDYVDDYLKTSRFAMTSKKFYEWKKANDNKTTNQEKGKQEGKMTRSASKVEHKKNETIPENLQKLP